MVNSDFVWQCASDIWKKTQNIEVFSGMDAAQLLQIAQKAFINQEAKEKREY